MSIKYKYHDPEGTDFISNAVVNWIDNDDLPGCSRAHVENTCAVRGVNTYDMVSVNARVMHDAMGQVINVPHEHLELEVVVPQDGYMFIYLVNESRDDTDVYFDDFTISHIGVDILKTTDFYPFGLALKNWQKEGYRFGYQGQFAEMDEETGWNSFELRMYDPIVARWVSTDPYGQFASPYLGMGNAPNMFIDPDGGLCCGEIFLNMQNWLPVRVLDGVTIVANASSNLIPTILGTGLRAGAAKFAEQIQLVRADNRLYDYSLANQELMNQVITNLENDIYVQRATMRLEKQARRSLPAPGSLTPVYPEQFFIPSPAKAVPIATKTLSVAEKVTITLVKKALRKVHKILGGPLPKGDKGKFGSPQRGDARKGYRLDPAHPNRPKGDPESVPHINWWDYTKGKRGKGGASGAEPILNPNN